MNWLKEHEIDSWILKGSLALMVLFPAFYSPHTDVYESAYYAGFSWAYFFLALYMLLQLVWNRKKLFDVSAAKILFLAVLLAYNVFSLYFNRKYLNWYWEQINNTAAFLFMGILLGFHISLGREKHDTILFLMRCIVLSNVASIVYYFMGYVNLLICNNQFITYQLPPDYYEECHYWLYSHKCEYALMLVAFIALFIAYRKKFRNKLTFALSMAVLVFCLFLAHSWTGIAGMLLIVLGAVLDGVNWKEFHFRKWHLAVLAAALAAVGAVAYGILSERDLSTLGARLPIWKAALQTILKYPQGWGMRFGTSMMLTETGMMTNNAHNLFLNQILRFSIPAGVCFTLLFLGIAVYTLIKGRSFLMTGTWLALLLLLNMDYSLMSVNMALVFLIVYLISLKRKEKRLTEDGKG
ncbi:MAG TPA: O-antigen ligase family protein [Candidatus Merdisoma merdipullorum]|nr:O-antigen ligase family protein [Candidatus Merdisoma merdipullorum]